MRDSVEALRRLPVLTERGAQLRLSDVASIAITDGPSMLKQRERPPVRLGLRRCPRARPALRRARYATRRRRQVKVPPGYSISWSGQFEYLERATRALEVRRAGHARHHLRAAVLTFRRATMRLIIMATLPFALVGGFWLIYLLGHDMSIASAVGFIALAGVAAEFGVVMLVYLKHAWDARSRARDGRAELALLESHPRRRCASCAAEHDDRQRRHRRSAADHVEQRNRIRGHAPHCRADDRRHDHRAALVAVRDSRGVSYSQASSRSRAWIVTRLGNEIKGSNKAATVADPHRRKSATGTSHADDLSLEDTSSGTDD